MLIQIGLVYLLIMVAECVNQRPELEPFRPRSTHEVMTSLDNKFRDMDALLTVLKATTGLEYWMESLSRRFDSLETKVVRIETKLDINADKLDESVAGREISDSDFILEHKIDTMFERLSSRLAVMEARISLKLDSVATKADRIERHSNRAIDDSNTRFGQVEHFQTQVLGRLRRLDDSVSGLSDLNRPQNQRPERQTEWQFPVHEIRRLTRQLGDQAHALEKSARLFENQTSSGCDQLLTKFENLQSETQDKLRNVSDTVQLKLAKVDKDLEIYTKKVSNIYQQVIDQKKESTEKLTELTSVTNHSKHALREGFKKVNQHLRSTVQGMESKLLDSNTATENRLVLGLDRLSTTLSNSFASILVAQKIFIESCEKLQDYDNQMEQRLTSTVREGFEVVSNNTYSWYQQLRKSLNHHEHNVSTALKNLHCFKPKDIEQASENVDQIGNATDESLITSTQSTVHNKVMTSTEQSIPNKKLSSNKNNKKLRGRMGNDKEYTLYCGVNDENWSRIKDLCPQNEDHNLGDIVTIVVAKHPEYLAYVNRHLVHLKATVSKDYQQDEMFEVPENISTNFQSFNLTSESYNLDLNVTEEPVNIGTSSTEFPELLQNDSESFINSSLSGEKADVHLRKKACENCESDYDYDYLYEEEYNS